MIELVQLDLSRIERAMWTPIAFEGCRVIDGGLPPPFILEAAARAIRDGKPSRWFGPFLFVDVDDIADERAIVGSAIFKGEPDHGWVEIGYGVAESVRGRGIATNAVFALAQLAFARPEVHTVYAETSVDNAASRRVVQKVGFRWAGQRDSADDGPVDCWFVEA